ncbi:hypothetical protein COO60DRAFT_1641689 [Scenedesmus sp. NREL 46B-D3]|nr:hypothetical protein COO60DRAFT_1641689 [Scenedesmus sp. NREL 46B-D3]
MNSNHGNSNSSQGCPAAAAAAAAVATARKAAPAADSLARSAVKGLVWRLFSTTATMGIALLLLHDVLKVEDALKLGALEFTAKFMLYFIPDCDTVVHVKLPADIDWVLGATSSSSSSSGLCLSFRSFKSATDLGQKLDKDVDFEPYRLPDGKDAVLSLNSCNYNLNRLGAHKGGRPQPVPGMPGMFYLRIPGECRLKLTDLQAAATAAAELAAAKEAEDKEAEAAAKAAAAEAVIKPRGRPKPDLAQLLTLLDRPVTAAAATAPAAAPAAAALPPAATLAQLPPAAAAQMLAGSAAAGADGGWPWLVAPSTSAAAAAGGLSDAPGAAAAVPGFGMSGQPATGPWGYQQQQQQQQQWMQAWHQHHNGAAVAAAAGGDGGLLTANLVGSSSSIEAAAAAGALGGEQSPRLMPVLQELLDQHLQQQQQQQQQQDMSTGAAGVHTCATATASPIHSEDLEGMFPGLQGVHPLSAAAAAAAAAAEGPATSASGCTCGSSSGSRPAMPLPLQSVPPGTRPGCDSSSSSSSGLRLCLLSLCAGCFGDAAVPTWRALLNAAVAHNAAVEAAGVAAGSAAKHELLVVGLGSGAGREPAAAARAAAAAAGVGAAVQQAGGVASDILQEAVRQRLLQEHQRLPAGGLAARGAAGWAELLDARNANRATAFQSSAHFCIPEAVRFFLRDPCFSLSSSRYSSSSSSSSSRAAKQARVQLAGRWAARGSAAPQLASCRGAQLEADCCYHVLKQGRQLPLYEARLLEGVVGQLAGLSLGRPLAWGRKEVAAHATNMMPLQ